MDYTEQQKQNFKTYDEQELYWALVRAIKNNNLDQVRYLLTSPDLKIHPDIHTDNEYCLAWACREGYLDIVKYLLTSPELTEHADIGIQDGVCFEYALSNGHGHLIDFLVSAPEFNASGHFQKHLNSFVRTYAREKESVDVIPFLTVLKGPEREMFNSIVLFAAQRNDLKSLKEYVALTEFHDILDISSAIRHGCESGSLESIQFLKSAPLKAYQKTKVLVEDLLVMACKNGHIPVVEYLLSEGEDIHEKNDEAYKKACLYLEFKTKEEEKNKNLELIKYLLSLRHENAIHFYQTEYDVQWAMDHGYNEIIKEMMCNLMHTNFIIYLDLLPKIEIYSPVLYKELSQLNGISTNVNEISIVI